MNTLQTEILPGDRIRARGKSSASIALDILNNLRTACPYSCTFVDGIPTDQKAAVEAQLKEKFKHWADSWLVPDLRAIISKQTP